MSGVDIPHSMMDQEMKEEATSVKAKQTRPHGAGEHTPRALTGIAQRRHRAGRLVGG
jgi:hypothetical protein